MPWIPLSFDELLHRTGPLQVVLLVLLSAALIAALAGIARRASAAPAPLGRAAPRADNFGALLPAQRSEAVDARPADR